MKNISYSDVQRRRRKINEISSPDSWKQSTKRASTLYESVMKNVNRDLNLSLLMQECRQNIPASNLYARSLAEIVNDNNNLEKAYLVEVVVNLKDGTLKDVIDTANINESFKEELYKIYNKNIITDKILYNHNLITEANTNIIKYAYNNRVTDTMLVNKVCDLVNELASCDPYAKFEIAVLETLYLFNYTDRYRKTNINESSIVDYIKEYYSMYSNNQEQRKMRYSVYNGGISTIISESLLGDDNTENSSELVEICNRFMDEGNITTQSINKLREDVHKCEDADLSANYHKYLNILFRIIMMPDHEEEAKYVLDHIVGKIYSDIKVSQDTEGVVTRLGWQIEKVDNYLTDYDPDENVKKRLYRYKSILEDVYSLILSEQELLYSEYDEFCINDHRDNLNKVMTLNEFKVFGFDNLVTRTMKVDKYIQKKFEPSRQKIFKKIADTRDEIFKEESVYDVVTPNGEVDVCVSTYTYESNYDVSELNKFLTGIIMETNESILNETDLTCYYILSPDYIEFHIKEYADIQLTDDERSLVENHISGLDEDRMLKIMSYSIFNENFNYIKDSVRYFIKLENSQERNSQFKDFIQEASDMGVREEIIVEIYNKIANGIGLGNDVISFKYNCGYLIENYTPAMNPNPDTVLRNYVNAQLLVEGTHDEYNAVNTKDLSKYGYKGEDDRKKHNYDDEDDDRPVRQSTPPQESHRYNKPEIAEDDYEDTVKQGPMKNMTPTNMKLMAKGIGKKVTDISAKEQRAEKMADASFNRLVKSCKDALVSDRREAIIRGSVIPSFSKSIKIGLALAALGAINPGAAAIAAIGGLIASKKLTERERSLLLDDIEVELQVIDKELQMAESNNQMNKYRALMKMKKDLQRQYQRIRYNIKFRNNKNPLPSKTGVDVEE